MCRAMRQLLTIDAAFAYPYQLSSEKSVRTRVRFPSDVKSSEDVQPFPPNHAAPSPSGFGDTVTSREGQDMWTRILAIAVGPEAVPRWP